MGFPTKNDHFGVLWGYHHLRNHPYGDFTFFLHHDVSNSNLDIDDSLPCVNFFSMNKALNMLVVFFLMLSIHLVFFNSFEF